MEDTKLKDKESAEEESVSEKEEQLSKKRKLKEVGPSQKRFKHMETPTNKVPYTLTLDLNCEEIEEPDNSKEGLLNFFEICQEKAVQIGENCWVLPKFKFETGKTSVRF